MFKNWGSWLGIENENGQKGEPIVDVNADQSQDINKPTVGTKNEQTSAAEEDTQPPELLQKAKGFSGKFDKS